jgi:NAD(P)H-dependent FMN reductase
LLPDEDVSGSHDVTVISVVVGSTRPGRFSEKPAEWILRHLQKRSGVEARRLDLRDYPMPFFDQPVSPAMPGRRSYEHEVVEMDRRDRGVGRLCLRHP